MSITSIESFFKQNFINPDFSIVKYYEIIQVPANCRDAVESEIIGYVTDTMENKVEESESFIEFLDTFKLGDFMTLKSDVCNKYWCNKLIKNYQDEQVEQGIKRKVDSVAPQRESKRLKEKNKISEDDALLHDQVISTATKIKRHAYDLYKNQVYHDFPIQAQNAISLGFNSVLDISNNQDDTFAQKQLFTNKEWSEILDIYGSDVKYHSTPDDVKKQLGKVFKKAKSDLVDAYKDCLSYQIKHALTSKEVYFKVLAHFISILKDNHHYLEGKHKTFTEANYAIKIWGPVLEYVFKDPQLVVQWGESVNIRSSAAKKMNSTSDSSNSKNIGDKIDFRICYDDHGKLIDLLNGEMGKEQRSEAKYFQDHSKLAREIKIIGDLFYSSDALKPKLKETLKVRGIQLSAVEGEIVECRLVDNGLYVLNKLGSLRLPTTEVDLDRCRTLVKRLLEIKRGCLALARTYRVMKEQEKDMENNMDKMKNHNRSPFNDSDRSDSDPEAEAESFSDVYQGWDRGSWFPPSKYSKTVYDGSIPPYLLSPPPTI